MDTVKAASYADFNACPHSAVNETVAKGVFRCTLCHWLLMESQVPASASRRYPHDPMHGLMSSRDEAQALAQRMRDDGYEVIGLDSMPIAQDAFKARDSQRIMWHVIMQHAWGGYIGRSFLSVAEYEAWQARWMKQ